ncbi:MAG TPA: NAD(P)-dependent oxidoreductase [Acidimicrobiales bacterium]|nr:NAD(P)-dependent oxidoreductase [Acidimicrobiales bacterium]
MQSFVGRAKPRPEADSTANALGWVGAGRMGAAMIERLLEAGHSVIVYNRTSSKVSPLMAAGAVRARSISDLAGRKVVFISVSSSDDLLAVTVGKDGLLALEKPPEVIVDVSTVSAEASAIVREKAAESGTAVVAAPASGNPGAVRAGRATFAVSGPISACERVVPALMAIGANATYCGEGEAARLVKLCHNLFLASVIQSLVEVALLAEKGGVDRASFLSFLNGSVLGSTFTGYKTPALVNLDFHPTFTSRLLRKDVELGLAAARDLEVPMPVAALVGQIVVRLVGEGYGEQDFAALIAMQAKAAGVDLEKRSALTAAKPPQTVAARGQITVPAPEDARKGGN